MKKIVIASKNKGKIKEFETLFQTFDVEILSLLDFPEAVDVEETGTTFEANARLKAEEIARVYQCVAIADDSGLVVDALDGRPGVYSARFAGGQKNDKENIKKVLQELEGVPAEQRTAHFTCVLAISCPQRPTRFVSGECQGIITEKPSGSSGFGYDPIFYVPEYKKTFAEISAEEKNEISHRAQAMKKLKDIWPEIEKEFF
ncbi:XTP/dITP diphosphohydrolase [Pullulanibacillus pueri]|uniref:dITP/XTP pyrophosphatase n=1 Tax=Pullulanibacillus pueri TaxID=1437324 RepID=A0A8J2ZX67_9BACL|nr:XTP/dITP diphosphatase [Pullulanibacillus pueri]MBM7681989.1 XTP/dITP diphosphohydrolase [Pullulanibacillus pueri]GGH83674.1 non-canonical purine NTP pyrophosphatase [Pullulanibacillus pueri]